MRKRLFSRVPSVAGLDLSLRAAAVCVLPKEWNQDISSARTMVTGYELPNDAPEEEQILRRATIAAEIVAFLSKNRVEEVQLEDYAFSQGQSRAHALGELGGVVKHEIYQRLGLVATPVIASRARKVLLQELPSARGKPKGYLKKFVVKNVRRLGGPALHWTDDEVDAFVVANHALMVSGGTAMTFLGEE